MKIEFFSKTTGQVLDGNTYGFIVINNAVYKYWGGHYKHQHQVIKFEDFVKYCPEVDWRVNE